MNLFINTLFFIYCFLFSGYILFNILIINIVALSGIEKYDTNILIYTIISLFILVTLWVCWLSKIHFLYKLIIFLLILYYLNIYNTLPSIIKMYNYHACIDTGVCKEGIYTKINGDMMEVNKENCLKYNKEWYESINSCYVR